MKFNLFLDKLMSMPVSASNNQEIISELSYFGLTWQQWAEFTAMTRGLDYGCNFGTKGRACSGYNSSNKCCCGNCRPNIGYLKLLPFDEAAIKRIASLFHKDSGFWREKKGCVLPAKYRSSTCIVYRCSDAMKHSSNTWAKGYATSEDHREQMILHFLDTVSTLTLTFSTTQIRTIIKALINRD